MALVLKDRVKETSITTGTGTITLAGASSGYQAFSVIGNGNTTYYTITDPATGDWEVGIGTYTSSGTTLSRDTVLSSSNAGSLVNFAAGTKDVFCVYPAEKAVYEDASNKVVQNSFVDLGVTGTATISTATITSGTVSTTPASATDIANKQYVDTLVSSGITYHTPVKYEVPAINLNATYNNGTAGVGATLTNAGTLVAFTPDGVVAAVNDRILIYNQTAPAQNGVYTVTTVGSGAVAWVLTRATDANNYALKSTTGLGEGDAFFIQSGTTGAGETYVCNTVGTITFGTTAITFVQISSAQIYSAGTGLTLAGTQFSITPVGTASTYGSASSVPVLTTNASGQVSSVTNTSIAINANQITAGTLAVARGGTNLSSYAVGDIVYASGTGTLAGLADAATGNVLLSGGTNTAPLYGKVGLGTHVSGTLPTANGGTALTSFTSGGAMYATSTSVLTTGTLPVASGGTGVTTSTGTGSVVLSSSPTLVTPALGTPSAVVLTSGTGLPLTTGVTGTLAVGNGGTGVTTLSGLAFGNGTSAFTAASAAQIVAAIGSTFVTNATNATNATNTGTSTIINDVATATTVYPVWSNGISGSQALEVSDTKLSFVPSTGTLTATTFSGALSGNATTATALATGRTIAITGDLAYTSPSFNGSGNVTAAGTLATVNSNVGSFTNATLTVNAKGLITAASSGTAPVTSVTGTAPVVSSGGTTPAISMAAATSLVSGYLTSTDWNTFNNKTSNTGTVTSITAGTYLTGGTITTSGTLTVDATSTNTASKVVARDGSGNFAAGTITAALSGNATTATTATTATNQSGGTVNATSIAGTSATITGTVSSNIGGSAYGRYNGTDQYHSIILRGTVAGTTTQTVTGGDIAEWIEYGGIWNFRQITTAVNSVIATISTSGVTAASFSGAGTGLTGTASSLSIGGNAATATTLATGRTIAITGDLSYTSPSFNGSGNVTAAGTLATVNSNVGSFTNATLTVNAKGLITAASSGTAPVLSVTGTAPVVSSGGVNPAISMAAATTSVNGYLTSTDWNTFNGKQAALVSGTNIKTVNSTTLLGSGNLAVGTVTSVGGTGTVSGLSLSGTVTTTGNLTLGGTLAVLPSNFASQTANTILAAPNGTAGVPTFRAIVAADIPTLNQNTTGTASNVTGTVAIANGGTGATTNTAARTNLGATTLGANIFTITNPSAITFPRFNADNTISALDAATFRTAIGAGTSSTTGTVTSVATAGTVSGLTLTGGTITTTGTITLGGTLAVTASNFASQTANTFLAAPNGAAGVPTFRAVVAADIPTLNQNTTGSSGSCTGNAATATTLQTARTIQGVSFNGSANITVATAGTGISVTGTTIANTGVTSVNGSTGAVTVVAGQFFGSAATKAIAYNSNTIGENVTVTAGNNGLSAGPITISSSFTVTVATGAVWVIV